MNRQQDTGHEQNAGEDEQVCLDCQRGEGFSLMAVDIGPVVYEIDSLAYGWESGFDPSDHPRYGEVLAMAIEHLGYEWARRHLLDRNDREIRFGRMAKEVTRWALDSYRRFDAGDVESAVRAGLMRARQGEWAVPAWDVYWIALKYAKWELNSLVAAKRDEPVWVPLRHFPPEDGERDESDPAELDLEDSWRRHETSLEPVVSAGHDPLGDLLILAGFIRLAIDAEARLSWREGAVHEYHEEVAAAALELLRRLQEPSDRLLFCGDDVVMDYKSREGTRSRAREERQVAEAAQKRREQMVWEALTATSPARWSAFWAHGALPSKGEVLAEIGEAGYRRLRRAIADVLAAIREAVDQALVRRETPC